MTSSLSEISEKSMISYIIAVKLSKNMSFENASFAKKASHAASVIANALASPGGRHDPRNSRSRPRSNKISSWSCVVQYV